MDNFTFIKQASFKEIPYDVNELNCLNKENSAIAEPLGDDRGLVALMGIRIFKNSDPIKKLQYTLKFCFTL